MPDMPDAFVREISDRYIELFEKVTGHSFMKDTARDIPARIEENILAALLLLK
ncbi:MAG: phosphoribosylaminoimidazolesuccinocarboxamide synthase, partial [Blastocatellia bacterium]|nr:phosphoribosylaminoimidazolesuccinocarboxamide synthase [Blastocatellia bacterium]